MNEAVRKAAKYPAETDEVLQEAAMAAGEEERPSTTACDEAVRLKRMVPKRMMVELQLPEPERLMPRKHPVRKRDAVQEERQ